MPIQRFELELQVLQRLRDGLLDGILREFTLGETTTRIYIAEGRPIISEYLANTSPTKDTLILEKEFETDEGKLWFIRNHGWTMDDVYACLYSHMYKRSGAI